MQRHREALLNRFGLIRFGAKAVQTAVLVIDRWPSQPWIARMSCSHLVLREHPCLPRFLSRADDVVACQGAGTRGMRQP